MIVELGLPTSIVHVIIREKFGYQKLWFWWASKQLKSRYMNNLEPYRGSCVEYLELMITVDVTWVCVGDKSRFPNRPWEN